MGGHCQCCNLYPAFLSMLLASWLYILSLLYVLPQAVVSVALAPTDRTFTLHFRGALDSGPHLGWSSGSGGSKMKKHHKCFDFTCLNNPGLLFPMGKSLCGMAIAGQGLIFPKIDRFKELIALLDFEKSNSPNHHIYHFHASTHQVGRKSKNDYIRGPAAGAKP